MCLQVQTPISHDDLSSFGRFAARPMPSHSEFGAENAYLKLQTLNYLNASTQAICKGNTRLAEVDLGWKADDLAAKGSRHGTQCWLGS